MSLQMERVLFICLSGSAGIFWSALSTSFSNHSEKKLAKLKTNKKKQNTTPLCAWGTERTRSSGPDTRQQPPAPHEPARSRKNTPPPTADRGRSAHAAGCVRGDANHTRTTQHTQSAEATWGADQRLIFLPRRSGTTWAEPNRMASLAYHLHKQSKGIRLPRGSHHVSFWGGRRGLFLFCLCNPAYAGIFGVTWPLLTVWTTQLIEGTVKKKKRKFKRRSFLCVVNNCRCRLADTSNYEPFCRKLKNEHVWGEYQLPDNSHFSFPNVLLFGELFAKRNNIILYLYMI